MGYPPLNNQRCPRPVLPCAMTTVIGAFASLCSKRVFEHATLLRVGAILAPGRRTVAAVLGVMGKGHDGYFQNDPRVLTRAHWSPIQASRVLLGLLLDTFVPAGPVLIGIDETIERRRGAQIAAKGIYRDPVRSSHTHVVKASGLRWVSLMVLARLPWAERVWALPFLTVLAPSDRSYHTRGRQPQSRLERARQAVQKGTRLPTLAQRVADQAPCGKMVNIAPWYGQEARWVHLTSATAVWYHLGLPAVPIRWVLIRDPAGKFAPPALLSTTLVLAPVPILTWFVQRWQLDTTVAEARTHLGLETSRQWHDQSTRRTTPALFGRYAIVTLAAAHLRGHQPVSVRTTAWYPTQQATFSETIASVRRALWRAERFSL
jgi:hypothetical protein